MEVCYFIGYFFPSVVYVMTPMLAGRRTSALSRLSSVVCIVNVMSNHLGVS